MTAWDPVSKQPLFKVAAVRVSKLVDGDGTPSSAPTTTASEPITEGVPPTAGGEGVRETRRRSREAGQGHRGRARGRERAGKQLRSIGEPHASEADLYHVGHTLARQCAEHARWLAPFAERYGAAPAGANGGTGSPSVLDIVRRTGSKLIGRSEVSGVLLLRDLRHLYLSAQAAEIAWVILLQAARAVRDRELIEAASECREEAEARGKWLRGRIKESCPQVLASG